MEMIMLNKQERIEEISTIIACGSCGQSSWDCPEDTGLKCYGKESAKSPATLLANRGYIKGTDLVDYLKDKIKEKQGVAACSATSRAYDICSALESVIKILDEALQAFQE